VDSILRGRLETQGSKLIVSASLVDTRDETQLWGQRLIREQGEALYLEQSIVEAITESLRLEVTDGADQARASGGTDDPEAYRRYLRGHHQIQATERDSIEAGLDELRQAIRLDPAFALPYADIADALSQLFYFGHIDGAHAGEARNAAHTAVGLAPSLAEAHLAMATVHQYFDFDRVATEEAFETAVSLSSQNPGPFIRYADYLWATGRWDRGGEMAARAVRIDPLNGSALHAVGINAMFRGEFDKAVEAFGDWNRFQPSSLWSYVKHATALALAGRCDLSLAQTRKLRQLSGESLSLLADSWLAWSHKVCGRDSEYREILARLQADLAANPESTDAAHFYHFQLEGDAEALFQFLKRWVDRGHPLSFAIALAASKDMGWPASNLLRADPRYHELLETMGLPMP